MFRFRILVMTLGLIIASFARAGDEVGNGGKVLVCNEGTPNVTYQLLEYWEAAARWDLQIDLGPDNLNYEEKIQYVINRLATLDVTMANMLTASFEGIWKTHNPFIDGALTDINDVDLPIIPHGCIAYQAARNQTPTTNLESEFMVDKRIWEKLDENNRAGLVLHELLYRNAVKYWEHHTSKNTRFYNAIISSTYFQTMDKGWYAQRLRELSYRSTLKIKDYGQVIYESLVVADYPDGASCAETNVICYNAQLVDSREFVWSNADTTLSFDPGDQIIFDDDYNIYGGCENGGAHHTLFYYSHNIGNLKILIAKDTEEETVKACLTLRKDGRIRFLNIDLDQPNLEQKHGLVVVLADSSSEEYAYDVLTKSDVKFYDNSMPKSISLEESTVMTIVPVTGMQTRFRGNVRFYPSGVIKAGILDQSDIIATTDGNSGFFNEGDPVAFDEPGRAMARR